MASREHAAIPTFYRIVPGPDASQDDFLSHKAKGLPAGQRAKSEGWWEGISAYDSLPAALFWAAERRYSQGRFIAAIVISDDSTIRYRQTTGAMEHYTLWGEPEAFMRCVQWVQSAAELS